MVCESVQSRLSNRGLRYDAPQYDPLRIFGLCCANRAVLLLLPLSPDVCILWWWRGKDGGVVHLDIQQIFHKNFSSIITTDNAFPFWFVNQCTVGFQTVVCVMMLRSTILCASSASAAPTAPFCCCCCRCLRTFVSSGGGGGGTMEESFISSACTAILADFLV